MALLGDKQKSLSLLQSVPRPEDPLWTKSLIQIPKVTYSMIYEFLVDRKVSRKRINKLEALPDIRAEKLIHKEESEDVHVPAKYTRTLNKGYRFFLVAMYKISSTTQWTTSQTMFASCPECYRQ